MGEAGEYGSGDSHVEPCVVWEARGVGVRGGPVIGEKAVIGEARRRHRGP